MGKRKLTERELLEAQQMQIIQLDLSSSRFGEEVEELEDMLPCIFHFNSKENLGMQHLNQVGLEYFDLSPQQAAEGGIEFLKKFAHPNIFKLAPVMADFYQKNDGDAVFSFFQRVRSSETSDWEWLFSTTKIYRKKNTLVTLSSFVNQLDSIGHKMNRLLDENAFMKENMKRFMSLTAREREVVRELAMGLSNPQIAEKLYISRATVEQHRKNINRKLEIENYSQLIRFALAFDLI